MTAASDRFRSRNMKQNRFPEPIAVTYNGTAEVRLNTVGIAQVFLVYLPEHLRLASYREAVEACKAAILGGGDVEKARQLVHDFAKKAGILVQTHGELGETLASSA